MADVTLNTALFRALNQSVDTPLEVWLWLAASSVGNAAVALAIAGAFLSRHRRGLIAIAIAFIVGGLVVQGCKHLLDLPRPLATLGAEVIVSGPRLVSHSFMSGHATTAASLFLLLWFESGRSRLLFLPLMLAAAVVAAARVAVGAHWPVDVLVGFATGIAVACLAWWAADRVSERAGRILAAIGMLGFAVGIVITLLAREPDLRSLAVEWRLLALTLVGVAVWRWRKYVDQPLSVQQRLRAAPVARDGAKAWMGVLKPVLGVVLIGVLVAQLDTARLWTVLSGMSPGWFAAAVLLAISNNAVSGLRWQTIAVRNRFPLTQRDALRLYYEGVAANSVLPGGIIGGDLWRTIGLTRIAQTSSSGPAADTASAPAALQSHTGRVNRHYMPEGRAQHRAGSRLQQLRNQVASRGSDTRLLDAGTTVLVDRVGGLWGLAVLSLVAALIVHLQSLDVGPGTCNVSAGGCGQWPVWLKLYALGLGLGVLALFAFSLGLVRLLPGATASRLRSQNLILRESLPMSVVVQIFSAATLWTCLMAVRQPVPIEWVCFLGAAIFVASILPAAIGGFGAREAAAVAVFVPLGLAPETAFAASVLFGLTVTVQGVLGMALWFRDEGVGAGGRSRP